MPTDSTRFLSDQTPEKASHHIPVLTGVRAVAAYVVFLHHYNPAPVNTFVYRLVNQGYIGVSIFFVLSGFLIYHRYADACFSQKKWSWRRYLLNRFARIYPLYLVLILITTGVSIARGQPVNWLPLVLNLTLLKGFFSAYKFSGIAQSWSLTVEICFYLSAPLLFAALRRWSVFLLTISLISVGLLLWAALGCLTCHGLFSPLPFVLFYTFFGRGFEFIVGMWLARRWHQNLSLSVRYATFLGLFVISGCMLWQAYVPTLITTSTGSVISEVIVYNAILPVGIGLFFLGLLREKSLVRQLLSQPVMQLLGRSSYAFYLIHIGIIASGLQKVGITNHWLLFGLLLGIAYGLYYFIENPLHQKISLLKK